VLWLSVYLPKREDIGACLSSSAGAGIQTTVPKHFLFSLRFIPLCAYACLFVVPLNERTVRVQINKVSKCVQRESSSWQAWESFTWKKISWKPWQNHTHRERQNTTFESMKPRSGGANELTLGRPKVNELIHELMFPIQGQRLWKVVYFRCARRLGCGLGTFSGNSSTGGAFGISVGRRNVFVFC